MLYCDLEIDFVPLWYGVPCLNLVPLVSRAYIPFSGDLGFIDLQGSDDPRWDELGSRFNLLFIDITNTVFVVPLDPVPSQQISVILGDQNCNINIYERNTL